MRNHLSNQTSPYLLQHADNPVDWYPWGEHSLNLAVQRDQPILLSIGYAACHWCHVMAHECFEDASIAAKMNDLFVCIKVDREERPDLDKIYQSAHHMLAQRSGGWPLTVAITPGGHAPFFAGTYFPATPRFGLPGFGEILEKVAAHYREHRQQLSTHHHTFEKALAELNPKASATALPQIVPTLNKVAEQLAEQFDQEFGGFGNAPKFPHPTQLELLLCHGARSDTANAKQSLHMLTLSLRNMAEGGLFDQLGGGFYRYSVDRQWCIPHFEKMLYDNAQLLALYSDAWLHNNGESANDFYRTIVAQIAEWVIKEMQQQHGGYASTLDADSEGVEGKYYVWSETDLRALLSIAEYGELENFYALVGEPNFEGNWHLAIPPDRDAAEHVSADSSTLQTARAKLLAARAQRLRPALDDKILTAWNGLMIKGMARSAKVFERPEWVVSTQSALDFIRSNLWQNDRLLVTSRAGKASLNGYLDDYAFLAEGIVELLQTAWRSSDLAFVIKLCDAMLEYFEDSALGGFFFTSHDHEKLLHRPKTGPDDAIPSGNAAAIRTLFQLGHLLGNTNYLQSAEKALQIFSEALRDTPSFHSSLCLALACRKPTLIIIRGADQAKMRIWQSSCQRQYSPERLVFAIPTTASGLPPALAQRKAVGNTIAYLCRGFECSPPIASLSALKQELAHNHDANG